MTEWCRALSVILFGMWQFALYDTIALIIMKIKRRKEVKIKWALRNLFLAVFSVLALEFLSWLASR